MSSNEKINKKKEGDSAPSGGQYSAFFFATFFYFLARTMLGDGGKWDSILLAGYVLLVIIYEFNMALKHTKERCGSPRFTLAFYYVVLPWLVVFGTLNAMLIQFPGWKAPFANTFGYLFLRLSGIQRLVAEILKPIDEADEKVKPSLQKIYTDRSLLVNEITPQNFEKFWNDNKDLFSSRAEGLKEAFRKKIILKDAVSEFIWFYLTGSLIMGMSFNYVAGATCELTPEEMEANRIAFEQAQKAKKTT
tara:strand:+ start:3542 stop:4285 length:744 start_codon:yes stop_codon:yes gene_type:complete